MPVTNCLAVVAKLFSNTLNTLIFLLQKCEELLLFTFSQQKISMYLPYFKIEILTSH